MEDKEKETLPESLKYRDQGHSCMYFPHKNLSFIMKVDQSVHKGANTDTFKSKGSRLIKVHVCDSLVLKPFKGRRRKGLVHTARACAGGPQKNVG